MKKKWTHRNWLWSWFGYLTLPLDLLWLCHFALFISYNFLGTSYSARSLSGTFHRLSHWLLMRTMLVILSPFCWLKKKNRAFEKFGNSPKLLSIQEALSDCLQALPTAPHSLAHSVAANLASGMSPGIILPQGLCTCSSLCPEGSWGPSLDTHILMSVIHISVSLLQEGSPSAFYPKPLRSLSPVLRLITACVSTCGYITSPNSSSVQPLPKVLEFKTFVAWL